MNIDRLHKAQDIIIRLSIAYIELTEKKLRTDKKNVKDLIQKSQELTYVDSLLSDIEQELLILQAENEELKGINTQQKRLIESLRTKQINNF